MGIISSIKARVCTREDVEPLVDFAKRMKKCHQADFIPQTAEEFLSKYRKYDSDSDDLNLSILYHKDKSIVGCSGYVPFKGIFAGKPLKGFIGTDAAIDPEYSKQFPNLAPILAHSYESLVRSDKLLPLICPANQDVSKDFQKVQWRKMAAIYRFSHPAIARLAPDLESSEFKIVSVDSFPESLNDFFQRVSKEHYFLMNTDVDFLNWKYFQNQYNTYRVLIAFKGSEIAGYIVTQEVHSDISIVDCVIDLEHPQLILLLMCKSFSYCSQSDIARTFSYLSHRRYIEVLQKVGFVNTWVVDCLFFKVALLYSNIDQNLFFTADSSLYHFNGFDQYFS